MQEPETIDHRVAEWIRHFVGFHEEAVFEYAPPEAWTNTVKALTTLATELARQNHDGWFFASVEPWWERTNEPTADPLENLDPSITMELASAVVNATRTITQAAELLLSSLEARESNSVDVVDDDAPF